MFSIPSLDDLVTRARLAFRANLPGSDAWVWPNNVGPSAKVIGGAANEVFGFADYVQRQKFALTADGENLDRHGAEFGLPRLPASAAAGNVIVTVADAFTVTAGALFQRSDGAQYAAQSSISTAGAGTLMVPVTAVVDGYAGNAIALSPLAMVGGGGGGFTDVNGDALATAAVDGNGLTLGADVEQDGAYYTPPPGTYRSRILFRKRNPPHGGNAADYVIWASEIPGVTRVFVERLWSGPGTVRVFPLMDNSYINGIPQAGDIASIAQYIQTQRPSGAIVTVVAPLAVPINISITGFTPNTTTSQEAVLAELRATFLRLSAVAGSDAPHPAMPYLAVPTSFAKIWVSAAIVDAVGSPRGVLALPIDDTALTGGQMATLGTVAFAS